MLMLVFYLVALIVAGIATLIGVREYLLHNHHHHAITIADDCTALSHRAGCALSKVATLIFALSPLVNLLGSLLLVYSHAHLAVCPTDQTLTQNAAIEE